MEKLIHYPHILYFKKTDEKAYEIYREVAQLIDIYAVDYNSLIYSSRHLVACAIFLVLCFNLYIPYFMPENINKFDFDKQFYIEFIKDQTSMHKNFVDVYGEFLHQSFNISFGEIIDTLVYCSKFLNFEFSYDLPLIVQTNSDISDNVYIY